MYLISVEKEINNTIVCYVFKMVDLKRSYCRKNKNNLGHENFDKRIEWVWKKIGEVKQKWLTTGTGYIKNYLEIYAIVLLQYSVIY